MELNERITFEAARASEEAFLQTGTWQSLSFEVKQRLGTRRLSARLSVLLGDLIKQKCVQIESRKERGKADLSLLRLPGILQQLREQQRSVAAEIKNLPMEIKVRLCAPAFNQPRASEISAGFQERELHDGSRAKVCERIVRAYQSEQCSSGLPQGASRDRYTARTPALVSTRSCCVAPGIL
jgi:hypothetical protein